MKTIGYIFKKTLSLAIMAMFTCLLWGENAWSGECTINTSSTTGLKSASAYASQGGCLSAMPLEVDGATNISSSVGPRNGPNGDFHYGMDVGTTGKCKSGRDGYNNLKVPADGTVWKVCWNCAGCGKGGGNYVVFEHELNPKVVDASERKPGSCTHYYTVFFHLSSKADGVAVGAKYQKDKVFGKVGGTNCRNGSFYEDLCKQPSGSGYYPHMHYEIHLCDWKKNTQNPLCPKNQLLCNNTTPVTESAASTFFNDPGPGSNNSGTPVNPHLSKKENCENCNAEQRFSGCPTTKNKEQCEARNKAIDEGGIYCDSDKKSSAKSTTVSGTTGTPENQCIIKQAGGRNLSSEEIQAITNAAKEFGISPLYLASICEHESGFSNKYMTTKGACGVVYPPYQKECAQKGYPQNSSANSIRCAAYVMREQINWFKKAGYPLDSYDKLVLSWYQPMKLYQGMKDTKSNGNNLISYLDQKYDAALAAGCMPKTSSGANCPGCDWNSKTGTCNNHPNCSICNYYVPKQAGGTKKIGWQTMANQFNKNRLSVAEKNNCATSGYVSTSVPEGCESFAWSSGDSYGGGADDTNATLTQYFSNYKCSLSENFNQIQGCLFCPLFRVIFDASSQIAKVCHEKFASSLIKLMAVGLAISLAWIIMQYVSDMTQKDPGIMLNAIFRKIFVVVVIIALLKLDVAAFFNMFVTPVFDTGFKIAELAITNTGVDLPDGAGTVDGSGLPAKMGISMLKGIYAVQNRLEKLMALGSNSICIAFFVKSYHGYPIFPHFGYLLTGVFMWITATIFMAIYPFLLIDSVLQFTVASSLFPAALAASAFELTKKYLNIFKIIHIFINAMFIFIFITIIMFILLAGIDNSLLPIIQRAYDTSDNDYFNLDNFIWYSKEFVKLIFFLFLGKAVLEDIPSFAEDFAKPLSMGESGAKNLGIGRSVGGTAARAATGIAKGGAEIAWKATKSTGGTALAGAALAGSTAMADIRSLRHNYLMNRTQKKLDKANAEAAASGRGPVTSVAGRNFWGQKVTRSIVKNPDGTMALQSTRKSLIRRREVSVLADENMSIKQKISKNGAIRESYKMDKSIARSLINKDGTINQKAINKLMQNSSLPKDAVNKAILNQLMQQRLPNAGRKIGFKWGWPPVTINRGASLSGGLGSTAAFVSEKINSYTDDKGREVFEVRRVGLDGNTSVYRMVKGESRAMVEYERITKNGHSHKWSSDGIIQKKESGRYDFEAGASQQQNAPAQVTINGAEMKGATIGSDGSVTDKNGNFVGMMNASGNIIDKQGNAIGTGKSADLVFDQNGKALGKIKAVNNYAYRTEAGTYNIKGHICDANGTTKAIITEDGQIINYTDKGGILGQLNKEQQTYLGKSVDNLNRSGYRAQKVEFSHARAYKGAKIFDDDGIIEDAFKDEELMFDDSDLELYKQQMKKYGDVINHHAFGR